MVFGIGEGKLEIILQKTNFMPGETITGQIKLDLSSPKKANELRILFYGEYKETSSHSHGTAQHHHSSAKRRIFEKKFIVTSDQEYPAGTKLYDFTIQIPSDIKRSEPQKLSLGPLSVDIGDDHVSRANWYLDASLDIPMAVDVNQKTQIYLQI